MPENNRRPTEPKDGALPDPTHRHFAGLHAKRCRYCGCELTLHEQYAGGVCSAATCRNDSLEADLVAFCERALRALGGQELTPIPIAVVPYRAGQIVSLEPEARSAFEAHLRKTAGEAAAATRALTDAHLPEEPQTSATTSSDSVGASVCAACSGFCCYHGGANAAFIDAATLQRWAATDWEHEPEQVVARYLSYLPERHFENSCVYHTASGCNLPRDMRSDMCNQYACKGLRHALAMPVTKASGRLFIVARRDNRIVRGVLVDVQGTREVVNGPPQGGDSSQGHSA